jgi:hypothetical protein
MQFTQDEQRAIQLFASMPRDARVRFPTWFVELVVPLAIAMYGWLADKPVFVGAAFGGLLFQHGYRLFRQFKYARELQSICSKVQSHVQQY